MTRTAWDSERNPSPDETLHLLQIWILPAVRGTLVANGMTLESGDALAVEDEAGLDLSAAPTADFLLFDLA